MRVFDVVSFICKREGARLKMPVTDVIIRTYRFCNMRREDDRVTRWISDNWRAPNDNHSDLWFAMCVARMALNEIDSMKELGVPLPWNEDQFLNVVKSRQNRGLRVYNPAYMIATPNWTGPKYLFLITKLLGPMWANREYLRPTPSDTLASFFARLHSCYGVGTFTAAQVVADMKYTFLLRGAADWWTWAAPGPGSRRGLNRVFNNPINQSWRDDIFLDKLNELMVEVNRWFPSSPFHAQDLQNVMCEFDKYERARNGEGKPKQKYTPFVIS
jgi:hypothetical protein